jgi:hypothetical protein
VKTNYKRGWVSQRAMARSRVEALAKTHLPHIYASEVLGVRPVEQFRPYHRHVAIVGNTVFIREHDECSGRKHSIYGSNPISRASLERAGRVCDEQQRLIRQDDSRRREERLRAYEQAVPA